MLAQAVSQGLDQGVASALRGALDTLEETSRLRSNSVFAKIRNNRLDPEEALDLVMSPGATRGDIRAVMEFFKDSPAELKTIRGTYVENMIDNVGAVTNADSMKQLAKIPAATKSPFGIPVASLSIILPKSLIFPATSFVSPTFGKIISNLLLLSALAIFLANCFMLSALETAPILSSIFST